MQNLWSPWRSQYIDSFKENSTNVCFLCNDTFNSNKDNENLIVHRSKNAFAILNKFPYNAGHILVCPIRHIGDLTELNNEEFIELNNLVLETIKVTKNIYSPQGYNLGLNIGVASGAGVPGHLHYHIVPRWNGDTNFMTSIGEVKIISQEIEDTFLKYKTEFGNLIGE